MATFDTESGEWPDLAMKRVKVAALKDHLSTYLRAVEHGVTIEVTNRERPIPHIVPARPEEALTWIPAEQPFATIRDREYPAASCHSTLLTYCLKIATSGEGAIAMVHD